MKRIIKDYFTFSKKERNAMLVLLLLIVFFMTMPYFYPIKQKPPLVNKALQDFVAQSRVAVSADNTGMVEQVVSERMVSEKNTIAKKPFPFDPNTISNEDWLRLGISDKTVRTIRNYLGKGGRFRKPEDIRKIWGMRKEDAERLIPYVVMEEKTTAQLFTKKTDRLYPLEKSKPQVIDINTAGEEDWRSLPGIGEVLATRIIRYRERTGGFVSMEQVKKTYGISDSVFELISPFLRIDAASMPKTNINTASVYQLKNQLGISEPVARAIVVYRQQYGTYGTVDDLKKLVFIPDSVFQRIVKRVIAE
ncbi:MAG: helix-hairpin-helix domain-containing protein [Bacteroidota bacterium]